MPDQHTTTDVKADEAETCDHPETSRFPYDYGPNGYLNTPKGERILCADCGTDLTDHLAGSR